MSDTGKKSVGSFGDIEKLIESSKTHTKPTSIVSEETSHAREREESAVYAASIKTKSDELARRGKAVEISEEDIQRRDAVIRLEAKRILAMKKDFEEVRRAISARLEEQRIERAKQEAELRKERARQQSVLRMVQKEFDTSDPIKGLRKCLVSLTAKRMEIDEQLKAAKAINRQLATSTKLLEAREIRLKKAERSVQKKQESAKKLRADLRHAKLDCESLTNEVRSGKRKITKLTKEIDANSKKMELVDQSEAGLEWLLANGGEPEYMPWDSVVVIGSGPFDEVEFWNFLFDRGVHVCETNSEGVSYMIVGRTGWSEEQLEMQIAAQQGDTLKVYSQEMALLVLASGTDMFDEPDQDTLDELAGDHPALDFLREGEMQWPLFAVPSLPNEFRPFDNDDWKVDESPLKKKGYTVGKIRGLPPGTRRAILAEAFTGELPFVHGDDYMRDWGRRRTRRRLWRIANHLAWLSNAWIKVPNHRYAVNDWVSDLAALEKKFYKPWMRFAWPQVKVPGKRRRMR